MSVVLAGVAEEVDGCDNPKSIRLFTLEGGVTGGVIGAVQVCEESYWRFLCDSNWTRSDAKVVCKSLNFPPDGEFPCLARGKLLFAA